MQASPVRRDAPTGSTRSRSRRPRARPSTSRGSGCSPTAATCCARGWSRVRGAASADGPSAVVPDVDHHPGRVREREDPERVVRRRRARGTRAPAPRTGRARSTSRRTVYSGVRIGFGPAHSAMPVSYGSWTPSRTTWSVPSPARSRAVSAGSSVAPSTYRTIQPGCPRPVEIGRPRGRSPRAGRVGHVGERSAAASAGGRPARPAVTSAGNGTAPRAPAPGRRRRRGGRRRVRRAAGSWTPVSSTRRATASRGACPRTPRAAAGRATAATGSGCPAGRRAHRASSCVAVGGGRGRRRPATTRAPRLPVGRRQSRR